MKNILFSLLILVLLDGCKVDNYALPNSTIKGKIVDYQTDSLVESGGSYQGAIVWFYQVGSTQPQTLNTFPDGTFTNSQFFAGDYQYVAEGPFQLLTTDTPKVSIKHKSTSEVVIKVIPNIRLVASIISQTDSSAIIKVTYQKVPDFINLVELGVVFSNVPNPSIVSFANGDYQAQDVTGLNLVSGETQFTINNLQANQTYYIRAEGLTDAIGTQYNSYSTQIELQQ